MNNCKPYMLDDRYEVTFVVDGKDGRVLAARVEYLDRDGLSNRCSALVGDEKVGARLYKAIWSAIQRIFVGHDP